MIKSKYAVLLTAAVFFLPHLLSAAEITEEEIIPEGTQEIYLDVEEEYSFFQRGRVKNLLAASVGYDDNANLDSQRNGDTFTQTYFKTRFTSPVTRDKKVTGILEYDFMSLLYIEENSLDVIKNGFNAGIENKINEEWEVSGGVRTDIYSYIDSAKDNFFDSTGYVKVKENLPRKFYHQLGYELGYKHYWSRNTRTSATVDNDKKRQDYRNQVSYELGKYFPNDLCNLRYEYYNNNSTEKYINYYDYDSHKVATSLTHLFNDKFFGFLSFARQYRKYRSRSIVMDTGSREWDKTYFLATALYYNLNKSLTFGLSYTYRQNVSNEPVENYSGSLVSLSTYYRF